MLDECPVLARGGGRMDDKREREKAKQQLNELHVHLFMHMSSSILMPMRVCQPSGRRRM